MALRLAKRLPAFAALVGLGLLLGGCHWYGPPRSYAHGPYYSYSYKSYGSYGHHHGRHGHYRKHRHHHRW